MFYRVTRIRACQYLADIRDVTPPQANRMSHNTQWPLLSEYVGHSHRLRLGLFLVGGCVFFRSLSFLDDSVTVPVAFLEYAASAPVTSDLYMAKACVAQPSGLYLCVQPRQLGHDHGDVATNSLSRMILASVWSCAYFSVGLVTMAVCWLQFTCEVSLRHCRDMSYMDRSYWLGIVEAICVFVLVLTPYDGAHAAATGTHEAALGGWIVCDIIWSALWVLRLYVRTGYEDVCTGYEDGYVWTLVFSRVVLGVCTSTFAVLCKMYAIFSFPMAQVIMLLAYIGNGALLLQAAGRYGTGIL